METHCAKLWLALGIPHGSANPSPLEDFPGDYTTAITFSILTLAVTKPLPSRNTQTNTPQTLIHGLKGWKKSCLSIGKAEVKLQTFPTSNFFHSTLLSDPSLIISWAKREVGLTRTNTRTRFGDLRREAKMRKRRTPHSLNWNLYYLSAKGEAEESKIQNKVLAIIQLQFLFPIKNNCRQRAVEISCLEKWGCGMRRVKVILISWFPHVFQAQGCW